MYITNLEFYKWLSEGELNVSLAEIVGLVVGFILLVNMLPSAINQFYTVSMFSWNTSVGVNDSATQAIWSLMPLVGVLAGFLLVAIPVIKRL